MIISCRVSPVRMYSRIMIRFSEPSSVAWTIDSVLWCRIVYILSGDDWSSFAISASPASCQFITASCLGCKLGGWSSFSSPALGLYHEWDKTYLGGDWVIVQLILFSLQSTEATRDGPDGRALRASWLVRLRGMWVECLTPFSGWSAYFASLIASGGQ